MPSSQPSRWDTVAASIVSNLIVTNVVVHVLRQKSRSLRAYYSNLHMKAVMLDVTSALWGTLLAQRIAGDGVVPQIAAAVAVQVVHDVVFGALLDRMPDTRTMALFRAYAAEHGKYILVVDAAIMVLSVVLSHVFGTLSQRDTMLLGTVALYVHLLVLDAL